MNIFELIKTNWQGLLIGVGVAIVICLILQLTAFKGSKLGWFLTILLTIAFGFAGMFVQSYFFESKNSIYAELEKTPEEVYDSVSKDIIDGWSNTNGGFSFEQITDAKKDNECPIYEDQIMPLRIHDFGSYVAFSYQNGKNFENVVFLKTDKGLIFDGVLNYTGDFDSSMKAQWFPPFYWMEVDVNRWTWDFECMSLPYYYTATNGPGGWTYDDFVSLSSMNPTYLRYDHWGQVGSGQHLIDTALYHGRKLVPQNLLDHFIKFGDIEIIGDAQSSTRVINTLYNYLYESVKTYPYNTANIIVDVSNLMCLPIPQDLQANYPVSAEFKEKYPDKEYYGVYNCNIVFNCYFVKGKDISTTTAVDKYIKDLTTTDTDKIKIDVVPPQSNYSILAVAFKNTSNNDISSVDLLQNPVKVTFTSEELNKTKTIVIQNISDLYKKIILLDKNVKWNYDIESEVLIFEEFRGEFILTSSHSNINFEYYYAENCRVVSVGLNPVGTIDTSIIDLQANPVKIIFDNGTQSYQFVFDDNTKLSSYQTCVMEMGDYAFTILSEQLVFASVTGKLTITATDKTMLFNYALKTEQSLNFAISVSETGTTNNRFELYSSSSNVDLIRETLSSEKVYNVTCVIYDNSGKLLETFNHTHLNSGACGDNWKSSNLVNGVEYILQLRFADANDSTITYLSDVTTFTFKSNTTFRIQYDVTKN